MKKNTKDIYVSVCNWAAAGTILILELYSSFEINFLNSVNLPTPLRYILRIILFCLHWLAFTALYQGIHSIISKKRRAAWISKNSNCYIDGTWLHIHDKDNVKIGVVEIKQDFYELKVNAENIRPRSGSEDSTKWHYIGAEFNPNGNSHIRLMGCYIAQRNNRSKQGVHSFLKFTSDENNVIYKMTGKFGDALIIEDGDDFVDVPDKTGRIFLFRMTDELKKYIEYKSIDDYNRQKLSWVMDEAPPEIAGAEYVKVLKEVYYRNELQHRRNELVRYYEENGIFGDFESVNTAIYNTLAYAMFADNSVDEREMATLESLTGLKRPLALHHIPGKEDILFDNRKVLYSLIPHTDALELFKSIISRSCRSIIVCNCEQSAMELSFLDEVDSLINEF